MKVRQNNMKIKFIGHRGNGYEMNYLLEETIEAIITTSNNQKISGIELDVRSSAGKEKDRGTLVVHHDANVNLLYPNGYRTKMPIKNMVNHDLENCILEPSKLRELSMCANALSKEKVIYEAIRQRYSGKPKIVTLEEVLKRLAEKGYNGEILLHLKDYSFDCLQTLCSLIQIYYGILNIKVQCDYESLYIKYYQSPRVPQGLLVNLNQLKTLSSKRIITSSEIDFYSINWSPLPYYNRIQNARKDQMQTIFANQKEVYFWTIDSLTNMTRLLKFICDIKKTTGIMPLEINIISNFPTLLYDYLNADIKDAQGGLKQQAIALFNELNGQLARRPEDGPKVLQKLPDKQEIKVY